MQLLKEKDLVVIVAPAGAVKREQIQAAIDKIESKGWKYEIGKNTFNHYTFGYNYSGTPQERAADMQWALDHPQAKAIWCARGGYGGVQIVDALSLDKFKENPKWLIGYSDNTVFHQHLNKQEIPTLHATVCKPLPQGQSEETYATLFEALEDNSLQYSILPSHFNRFGECSGIISGGNLSILYSLIGSQSQDNFKNKILFIEDLCENYYHIDRMLIAMERAGCLKGIKGLIVGGFTKMDDEKNNENYNNPFDEETYRIISERFKKYDIPKIFGFPAGHIYDNRAIIMGGEVTLQVEKEKVLFSNRIAEV